MNENENIDGFLGFLFCLLLLALFIKFFCYGA